MIIIGGGLGGLATGAYARMSGYRTHILEMHEIPGGSCTSWDRGDFTFDWCVSWLLGSGPGNEMHQIWLELGAIQGKEMRQFDVFNIVRGRDGQAVYFYSDPDRLQRHLTEISPADARRIRHFCQNLRTFRKALAVYPFLKPVGMMGRAERWRMLLSFLPYFNAIRKSITELMTDYSRRFQHPLLREAFNFILYEKHPDFPVLPFYFQLASHANHTAGVPEGGSLGLARSVEDRYRRLGGEITYNALVEEILVEDDRAVGVRLTDGREFRADIVVSACDGRSTLLGMLGGRYLNDTYRRLYSETIDQPGMLSPGYVSVFLGLRRPFPEADPCTTYLLDEQRAEKLLGLRHPSINVQFRNQHYPELSPEETSVVYATYFSEAAPWRALRDGPEQASRPRRGQILHTLPVRHGKAYAAAKRRARITVETFLDERFPGLRESVAVRDVSTPLTQIRYTASHNGSFPGWQPFMDDGGEALEKEINRNGPVLPGLANFYMSGVWVTVGGLIRAVAAGRQVVQFICRDDGREFTAEIDDHLPPPRQRVVPVGPRPDEAASPAPREPVGAARHTATTATTVNTTPRSAC
ncbi:phytoene desaturase family protein [Streptomyces profundus]|uniref:phytoene desaturase family protein n=1 Tax=Streptomyces profundus TaxID=2867410 RepID=UPI001D1694A7|nr:NAD(P)/FAD-dependent oxidoreductase [Streptomyces sp. MA3_2.13]UED87321.1 NAD(P)/FAD-dependent oxidoreductase [Streptomyces sp. MA3_2.13]